MNTISPSPTFTRAQTLLTFLLFSAALCQAQSPPQNTSNPVASAGYVRVQRGPDSRVWQQTTFTTNQSGDVSTSGGTAIVTSPAGQQFATRVYGLALMDGSTGSNVLIAPITNSMGLPIGNTQIVYWSAFAGVQADIQDTYLLSGFEQNMAWREQVPSPGGLWA